MKSFDNFFGEARTKAGLEAEKKGLTHTGKGYYADKSGTIVAKAEGGERLSKVSKADQSKLKSGEPLNGPQSVADVQTLQQFAKKAKQAQQAPAQESPLSSGIARRRYRSPLRILFQVRRRNMA